MIEKVMTLMDVTTILPATRKHTSVNCFEFAQFKCELFYCIQLVRTWCPIYHSFAKAPSSLTVQF